ncbi:hypothetical protein FRC17_000754 [Serendipita sp. 399]|nr:hypothetical protein FRC17_000754 [Serendipita sp. 399]
MVQNDWTTWLVLAILGCPSASAFSLRSLVKRRAAAAAPALKRELPPDGDGFEIPLHTDSLGRYVASISMGNQGTAGVVQNFSFVLSTSSPYTAVAGSKCAACVSEIGSSSLYNTTISETEVALNRTQTLTLGDSALRGDAISEAFLVANDSQNFFANGAAGLLGLGRSSAQDSFIDTVFRDHQGWKSLAIGLALDAAPKEDPSAPTAPPKPAGVITMRQTDSSLYEGSIKYSPVLLANASEVQQAGTPVNYPSDWSLKLDSWTVQAGRTRTQYTLGGVAVVEPYFPEIRMPQDQAMLFYRDVNGALMLNGSEGLTWTLPCKPDLSLDVIFSGTTFTVGADQLVEGDTSQERCTGVVRGWDNPFVSSYMLGAAFARTVYIVYNATRDGSDTIGFAPRPGSSTLRDSRMSAGAVAGISVGATVAFFLVVLIAFLWWRHRRAVRVMPYSGKEKDPSKSAIEPYTPLSATSPGFKTGVDSPGFSATSHGGFLPGSPGFTVTTATSGNGHAAAANRTGNNNRGYVIEQGPIGGDVSASVPSSVTPESSPRSTMMPPAHRRKAEEAGLLAPGAYSAVRRAGGGGGERPQSQGGSSNVTQSTDYLGNLLGPTSPGGGTTAIMNQPGGALPSTPGSQVYHPTEAIPQTQQQLQQQTQQTQQLQQQQQQQTQSQTQSLQPRHTSSAEPLLVRNPSMSVIDATALAASAASSEGGNHTRHHSTMTTNVASPMSPQIHYHIHLTPGTTATNFPPGSIIHEYNEDEPAPEYSERPRSMMVLASGDDGDEGATNVMHHVVAAPATPAPTTGGIPSPPNTATTGHFSAH